MATATAGMARAPSQDPWPAFLDGLLRDPERLYQVIVDGAALSRICWKLLTASTILLGFYGLLMGMYGGWQQAAASMAKMPLLFFATLAICAPSLYMFNIVLGSKLRLMPMLTLILFSIAASAAVAASLALIGLFFMASGSSYNFLILLHVTSLGVGGVVGMVFMYRGLMVLLRDADSLNGARVCRVWMFVYGIVGCQMAWLLRPFLGSQSLAFTFFRGVEGNFFTAVAHSLTSFFGYVGY